LIDITATNVELFGVFAAFQKRLVIYACFCYRCLSHFCFSFESDMSYNRSKR